MLLGDQKRRFDALVWRADTADRSHQITPRCTIEVWMVGMQAYYLCWGRVNGLLEKGLDATEWLNQMERSVNFLERVSPPIRNVWKIVTPIERYGSFYTRAVDAANHPNRDETRWNIAWETYLQIAAGTKRIVTQYIRRHRTKEQLNAALTAMEQAVIALEQLLQ